MDKAASGFDAVETGAYFVLVLVIIQFVEAKFSIAATSVIRQGFCQSGFYMQILS